MKKNLKIIGNLFKQNKFKNIVIIIQIIVSIFVLTFLLQKIVEYSDTSKLLAKMDFDNTIVFSESLHISKLLSGQNRNEKYEKVKEYLKDLDGVKNVYNTYNTSFENNSLDLYTFMYDDGLIEKNKFNLEKGTGFNKENLNNKEFIPIIVSSGLKDKYKLGETYEFGIYSIPEEKDKFYKVKVVGILKNEEYIYVGSSKQTTPQVADLFLKTYKNEEFVIMPNRIKDTENYSINSGFTVELSNKEDFVRNSYDKVIEKGIGRFTLKDKYQANFYDDLIADYDSYIFIFIITYIFIITSIGGYNLLATLNYKRLFTIYYINGMQWEKGIKLVAIRNLLLIMIPTIIATVICNLLIHTSEVTGCNTKVCIITIILFFVVFLITTIGTIFTLIKTKPSEVLKEID